MNTNQISPKRNFTNTVTAGLKSLSGKGKTFYVLEFKNNSQLHKASSTKEIIVDYIELGRNPKCQVRFGEDCRTVSGVHCAIMREGDQYYVKHLSKTNPTLINGKPVADKWYLSSGDELTLSYGGPVIGFIVPANNFTSSIPLTRRLSLFREQALRPYKRAIAGLAAVLVLCIAVSVLYAIDQNKKLVKANDTIKNLQVSIDTLTTVITGQSKKIIENQSALIKYKNQVLALINKNDKSKKPPPPGPPPGPPPPKELEGLFSSVYYIYATEIEYEIDGEIRKGEIDLSGTGFLLNDGSFVTARHVVEPWYYLKKDSDEAMVALNMIASNNGKVKARFKAISSDRSQLEFSSEEFKIDKSNDKLFKRELNEEEEIIITKASIYHDWAVKQIGSGGNITGNEQLANNLPVGASLFTLGFPYGLGVNQNGVKPMYADFTVSSAGIDNNGFINISGRSFDPGNSGGPVFVETTNGYEVIGIISAGLGSQGIVIPISRIR